MICSTIFAWKTLTGWGFHDPPTRGVDRTIRGPLQYVFHNHTRGYHEQGFSDHPRRETTGPQHLRWHGHPLPAYRGRWNLYPHPGGKGFEVQSESTTPKGG